MGILLLTHTVYPGEKAFSYAPSILASLILGLDDPSLHVDPIPFDEIDEDADEDAAGISIDDIAAIIRGLNQGER